MEKIDNRLVCPEVKKDKIRKSRLETMERRTNQIVKTYELKINQKRLNKKQKNQLNMLFVEAKWFYNYVLNLHESEHIKLQDINTTKIKNVSHYDQNKELITTEIEYLSAAQKQAILTRMISNQKTIVSLIKNGYQKHGKLDFKSDFRCIPYKQYGSTHLFKSSCSMKLQGISKKVIVKGTNQIPEGAELANGMLIHKPDGYYFKLICFIDKNKISNTKSNHKTIGLDFGIKTNITTSEGEKLNVSIEESDRLKKLQRKMFRQKKGSNNRNKTRNKIQREYQHMFQKKQDKTNKIIHYLKQFDNVIIQDEQLSNWTKSGFGKNIQHSCMGMIKSKLKTLGNTIVLNKFIPTTKFCPECFNINKNITLGNRIFKCNCGYEEDRDIHAAKNMIKIYELVSLNSNLSNVPTEHREVTLEEFKTAVFDQLINDKSKTTNQEDATSLA